MKNKRQEKYIRKGKRYTLFFSEKYKEVLEIAKETARLNNMSFQKYANISLFVFPIITQSLQELLEEYEKEGKDTSALKELKERVNAHISLFLEKEE